MFNVGGRYGHGTTGYDARRNGANIACFIYISGKKLALIQILNEMAAIMISEYFEILISINRFNWKDI